MQVLVGTLLLLGLASAAAVGIVAARLNTVETNLRQDLRPAQLTVAQLTSARISQESGARGFLLTGDPTFLKSYEDGGRQAAALATSLQHLLRAYPAALAIETEAVQATQRWTTQAAEPAIATRRNGRSSTALAAGAVETGRRLFDDMRSRLDQLGNSVDTTVAAQVHSVTARQDLLNALAIAAAAIVVIVALLTQFVLRRSLATPVEEIMSEVERVAAGDFEHSVNTVGPPEVARIARGVESMRRRILEEMAEAAEAQARAAMADEDERIALDLHDRVIQRIFATGLTLQALATLHPSAASTLQDAIDDLDKTIRELRAVVFDLTTEQASPGLREQVLSLSREIGRGLGIEPVVSFDGAIDSAVSQDVATETLSALREILSNVPRHATATSVAIQMTVAAGMLTVRVDDDGRRMTSTLATGSGRGLQNLSDRVQRLGGTCTFADRPGGGTRVSWQVPAHTEISAITG